MSTAFPPSAWIWPFLHKNRPSSFIIDDSACFVNQESEVQEKKATATTKPLPLGEVALRSNDGEGKPGTKEPPRSDKQALSQSDTIAVFMLLSWHPCPLRRFAPALPKGEPFHTVRRSKKLPLSEELEVRFIRTRSFCHLQTHRRWRSGTLPAGRRPAGSSSPHRRRRR